MNFTITQWLQKESNGRIIFFYPFEIEKKRKFQEEKFLFIRSGIEPETLRLQLSAPSLFYLQDYTRMHGQQNTKLFNTCATVIDANFIYKNSAATDDANFTYIIPNIQARGNYKLTL